MAGSHPRHSCRRRRSLVGLGSDRPLVPDVGPTGALLAGAACNRPVTTTITIGGAS